jgi:hypothetical protein
VIVNLRHVVFHGFVQPFQSHRRHERVRYHPFVTFIGTVELLCRLVDVLDVAFRVFARVSGQVHPAPRASVRNSKPSPRKSLRPGVSGIRVM